MREFKFRVWDSKFNNWMPTEDDSIMIDMYGQIYFQRKDQHNYHALVLEQYRFKIMQYTGLKDMDGKEIYDGDILKCNGGADDFYFVVGFDHARFTAKVNWLKDKDISDYGYPPLMAYVGWKFIPEYSVVGNIYENLELLTKVNVQPDEDIIVQRRDKAGKFIKKDGAK